MNSAEIYKNRLENREGIEGPRKRVLVLMATYNAGEFLREQISSIERQSWPLVDVLVSDDGSTDGTVARLQELATTWQKGTFTLVEGPRQGFAQNFRSLMSRSNSADYVAISDQDDVWDVDKLEQATAWLDSQNAEVPALFCSRTRLIDEVGEPIGLSPLFEKPPTFRSAIVQSIAGGNTMVLNKAGAALVAEASRRASFVSHDWWCYMLVSGSGGTVHYSPTPTLAYRQHGGNAVGANRTWRARLKRLGSLFFTSRFSDWSTRNEIALKSCADLFTDDTISVLREFERARSQPLFGRLGALKRSGIYRQTFWGQIGLWLACAFRRL